MESVYTLLLLAAVPSSVLCGHVPTPDNIEIKSRHFIHLLTWEAGPGSPAEVYYRVTYRSIKDDWRTVESCAQVRYLLRCNLTDVFSNLDEMYYISITAISGKETSTPQFYHTPFRPSSDTEPEPPSLRLSPCNDSLCVYLQSPSQRLREIYEKFHYTLNVTNEKGVQVLLNTRGLRTMELKVVPGLQYCVSVNIDNQQEQQQRPANKTVCATKPATGNYMDAMIPAVLCLIALVAAAFVFLFLLQRPMKKTLPLVLRSFHAPYKVQLLWPAVENLNFDSLAIDMHKNLQVNKKADHKKVEEEEEKEEEVVYERLGGCQDASCEDVLEETRSSVPGSPANQLECNRTISTKESFHSKVLIPHQEATAPKNGSSIFLTHLFPFKTPTLQLKKNDSALLWSTREHGHRQEEEDSDDVNFLSLIVGGQNFEQKEEEAVEEEQMENLMPEKKLCVLEALESTPDVQSASSENTNRHISYSEDDEDEDTDEVDDFSGYMMRN